MLFMLKRKDDACVDEVQGFVVRVGKGQGSREARKIASENAMDEKASVWLDSKKSTCLRLKDGGVIGVVMRDARG